MLVIMIVVPVVVVMVVTEQYYAYMFDDTTMQYHTMQYSVLREHSSFSFHRKMPIHSINEDELTSPSYSMQQVELRLKQYLGACRVSFTPKHGAY
jgi:hypothetical protein